MSTRRAARRDARRGQRRAEPGPPSFPVGTRAGATCPRAPRAWWRRGDRCRRASGSEDRRMRLALLVGSGSLLLCGLAAAGDDPAPPAPLPARPVELAAKPATPDQVAGRLVSIEVSQR